MRPTTEEEQVWVTVSYTVNLGNYESAKVEMGTRQNVESQDPADVRVALCEKLMDEVVNLGEDMRRAVPRYRRARAED